MNYTITLPDFVCRHGEVFGAWEIAKTLFALIGIIWLVYFIYDFMRTGGRNG